MSFQSFDLHSLLLSNIDALGFTAPTPIQAEAIPIVSAGRDVMGLAQTGTGKTAAFMLPILDRLLKQERTARPATRALIIAPTRELAEQIAQAGRDLAKGSRIKIITVYGGVSPGPQISGLKSGAQIVVACPGRLLDHMNQGLAAFPRLETLVLDEADHMFDMGFLPDIRRILAKLPDSRQNLLFSATMPDDIRRLAGEVLNDPAEVRIGRQAPAKTVSHAAYPVRPEHKTALLLALLDKYQQGPVLVFTKTKHRAKRLAEHLAKSGHKTAAIQGNLSQRRRQEALNGFKDGTYRVLVATDIAARGIDVSRVAHVINYDVPDTAEAYTHRIGRTGRAECTGNAHTFLTGEDGFMARAIERILDAPLPRLQLEGFEPGPDLPGEETRQRQTRGHGDRNRPRGQAGEGRSQGLPARRPGGIFGQRPGRRAPRQDQAASAAESPSGYLIEPATLLKMALMFPPSRVTAAMMAAAIKAASKPYSTAVAPSSFPRKRRNLFMSFSLGCG